MADPIVLHMVLPRVRDIELVAIDGLEALARHLGIAQEKVGEAKIIVAEAVTNALEHAGDLHPSVRVEFTMTADEIMIFVQDNGTGFDPASVVDPDIASKLHDRYKRGWGLKLMRSLSDDFRIESGSQGTTIVIRKLLS
jgi:serine/threonine-protein kinase RsbW